MTSQRTACDNMLQDSNADVASVSTGIQTTSIPAAAKDKAQENPKASDDLYLDGSTVIAEVCPFFYARVPYLLGCGSRPSHMRQRTTVRRLG